MMTTARLNRRNPKGRQWFAPPPASRNPQPVLRFSPSVWAKLLFLRDLGATEIGGFGVTAADDLLRVEELHLIRQQSSAVSVAFDDAAVAEFFDQQVDRGLRPEQFARIWIHTHPGDCPLPSLVDEETFARVFGRSDWAVMFIRARSPIRRPAWDLVPAQVPHWRRAPKSISGARLPPQHMRSGAKSIGSGIRGATVSHDRPAAG